ncbi:hypothetical protein J437_LFUL000774, partial [Ladona fulva]
MNLFSKGYLEEGLMVKEPRKLRRNYFRSPHFKLDLVSIIPTELVVLGFASAAPATSDPPWPPPVPRPVIARLNRLARLPRANTFFSKTETRTPHPNAFRIAKVLGTTLLLIHWNACAYFALSCFLGFGSDGWVYGGVPAHQKAALQAANSGYLQQGRSAAHGRSNGSVNMPTTQETPLSRSQAVRLTTTLSHQYIYSFYWSTLTLTTIGETPPPETELEHVFVAFDFLAGVLIFATIVGNVGTMVSGAGAARLAFRAKCDAVKRYLTLRKVSKELEDRVIRWFDYVWASRQALMDEEEGRVLSALPPHLRSEIALHVHLETLRQVRIFQDAEPGLLAELVLKLRLQPRRLRLQKGRRRERALYREKRKTARDVGLEERNTSEESSESEEEVVQATLGAGSVFGEVALLEIPGTKTGNRRTASVRSVGYSDLFCLSKADLWAALEEYPAARRRLSERSRRILAKDGLLTDKKSENDESKETVPKTDTSVVPKSEETKESDNNAEGGTLKVDAKDDASRQSVTKHVKIGRIKVSPVNDQPPSIEQKDNQRLCEDGQASSSDVEVNTESNSREIIDSETECVGKIEGRKNLSTLGKSVENGEMGELAGLASRQSTLQSDDDIDDEGQQYQRDKSLEVRIQHM